jgi:multidrug efflux pump subunit AcrA (membrane-fusion protein)
MALAPRLALLSLSLALTMAAGLPPRPVRVQTVAFTSAERTFTYSGTIQARVQAELAFRVGGKIVERPVNLGDRVKAGQLLARLDPTDFREALESQAQAVAAAAADAANARAEMQRYERLGRNSAAFMLSEYDRRQATLNSAEAKLAQARRQQALAENQLAYSELRADADGLVAALPMQVGQVAQAGQTVASLAHSQEIEAAVDLPENRLPEARNADKVTLLDPPAEGLGLGMTAAVRFVRHAGTPLALLPASALTDRDGAPAVWVLDPKASRAALRQVTLAAASDGGLIAVSGGLRDGEQVVTAGASQMQADLPVCPWPGTAY